MRAGALDRKIRLLRPVQDKDRLGAPSTTFDDATPYPHPAGRVYVSSAERVRAAEVGAVRVEKFEIRWDPAVADIDETWRVIGDDGREYNLVAVSEIDRRKGWWLTGHARAETPDPSAQ
jgi:head-tail adaptor